MDPCESAQCGVVANARQLQSDDRDMRGIEADIYPCQSKEAAPQQAGGAQEDDRESDLPDEESVARTAAPLPWLPRCMASAGGTRVANKPGASPAANPEHAPIPAATPSAQPSTVTSATAGSSPAPSETSTGTPHVASATPSTHAPPARTRASVSA